METITARRRYRPTQLEQAIAEQGRRLDWLATNLGVHPSMVTHWLKGRNPVPEVHAVRIAGVLDRPLGDLFEPYESDTAAD